MAGDVSPVAMFEMFFYHWTIATEWMVSRLTIGINGYSTVQKRKRKSWHNTICDKNRGKLLSDHLNPKGFHTHCCHWMNSWKAATKYTDIVLCSVSFLIYIFGAAEWVLRLSSSASPTWPPLCPTCWSPGLPLWHRPLLLWKLSWELHTFMSHWLNHCTIG